MTDLLSSTSNIFKQSLNRITNFLNNSQNDLDVSDEDDFEKSIRAAQSENEGKEVDFLDGLFYSEDEDVGNTKNISINSFGDEKENKKSPKSEENDIIFAPLLSKEINTAENDFSLVSPQKRTDTSSFYLKQTPSPSFIKTRASNRVKNYDKAITPKRIFPNVISNSDADDIAPFPIREIVGKNANLKKTEKKQNPPLNNAEKSTKPEKIKAETVVENKKPVSALSAARFKPKRNRTARSQKQKAEKIPAEKVQKTEKDAENAPRTPEKVGKMAKQRSDYLSKKLSKISPILSLKTYKNRNFGRDDSVLADKSYFYENFDLDFESPGARNQTGRNTETRTEKNNAELAPEADIKRAKSAKRGFFSEKSVKVAAKGFKRGRVKTTKNIKKSSKNGVKVDKSDEKAQMVANPKKRPLRQRIAPLKWWENQKRLESDEMYFCSEDVSADLIDDISPKKVEIAAKKIAPKISQKRIKIAPKVIKKAQIVTKIAQKPIKIAPKTTKKAEIAPKVIKKAEIVQKIAQKPIKIAQKTTKAAATQKKKKRKAITFESAVKKRMAKKINAEPEKSKNEPIGTGTGNAVSIGKAKESPKKRKPAENIKKSIGIKRRPVKNKKIAKKQAPPATNVAKNRNAIDEKIAKRGPKSAEKEKNLKKSQKVAESANFETKESLSSLRNRIIRKSNAEKSPRKADFPNNSSLHSDMDDMGDSPGPSEGSCYPKINVCCENEYGEQVYRLAEIAKSFGSIKMKKIESGENSVFAGKALSGDTFSFGFLVLPPKAKKRLERPNCNQLFFVHGAAERAVKLSVNESALLLSEGACFLAPRANPYSIENTSRHVVKLCFWISKR